MAREGQKPGYDILSWEVDGSERKIEVKSTIFSGFSSITLTENERRTALRDGPTYCLYLVAGVFKKRPVVEVIPNPAANQDWGPENPVPTQWRLALP